MLRAGAEPRDLGKERADYAQLVQGLKGASVAAFPDEHLPELEVRFLVGGQLRTDPLHLLDEEVPGVAVDRQAVGLGDRVEPDHVGGPAGEDFLVVHRDAAVPDLEGRVDRLRLRRAPSDQRLGRVLHRAAIDQRVGGARDLEERDEGVAHELLHAQLATGIVNVSKGLRQPALVVEGQPVVAPAGRVVQLVAEFPEQIAGRAGRGHFARRQEAALSGLAETGHLVPHACDPQCRLQVAESALALFDVRLEQPDRPAVALAPLVVLLELVGDELLDPARLQLGDDGPLESLEELRVAGDEPAVEERGADGVVLARQLDALFERARRIAGFEAGIPKRAVQLFRDDVGRGILLLRQEREQIHVRPRRQLSPSVPAGRHHRQRRLLPFAQRAKQLADDRVGEVGDGADDFLSARPGPMPREDLGAPLLESRLGVLYRGWPGGHAASLVADLVGGDDSIVACEIAGAAVTAPGRGGGGRRRNLSRPGRWPRQFPPGSACS